MLPAISPPPRSFRIFLYDGLRVRMSRLFLVESSSLDRLSSLAASTTYNTYYGHK